MSRSNSFDAIRYIRIKMLQVRWFSRQDLEFTVTFLLFYLFNCKYLDPMIFLFYKVKCARLENWAHPNFLDFGRPSAPDWHRARNLSRPDSAPNFTINVLS